MPHNSRKGGLRMIIALASGLRKRMSLAVLGLTVFIASVAGCAQTAAQNTQCHIGEVDYQGWHAEQLSNRWLQLIIVPQNGGRLMQVTFSGHPYLFVNPKLAGKYY